MHAPLGWTPAIGQLIDLALEEDLAAGGQGFGEAAPGLGEEALGLLALLLAHGHGGPGLGAEDLQEGTRGAVRRRVPKGAQGLVGRLLREEGAGQEAGGGEAEANEARA